MFRGFGLGILFNSESAGSVETGSEVMGLSSITERGTTQRKVKAPKN